MSKLKRAVLTLLKYAFWTGVGEAAVVIANSVGGLNLPDYVAFFIGGLFKSFATYAKTEAKS
jgi:hypothetical protein